MQRNSWIALGICAALAAFLAIMYLQSQGASETFTQETASQMIQTMQDAVRHKNVGGIMQYITPDDEAHIAGEHPFDLQILLARAFRASGQLRADVSHMTYQGETEPSVAFHLVIFDERTDMNARDYEGDITLHLQRVDVPHLLGLYKTKEWRITGAETTGPDPASFGE